MMNADIVPQVAKPEPQVPLQINKLASEIESIVRSMDALEKKLTTILAPACPDMTPDRPKEERASCTLAIAIKEQAEKISFLRRNLDMLIDRIQL